MQIGITLIKEFEDLYNTFAFNPMGLKLLEITGISPKQMDMGLSSYQFFEEKLADIAGDSNSNMVENISPSTYRTHVTDSQMKLLGYHTLWYHTKKRYGLEFANRAISLIWDGSLYFHDAHGIKIQMPYCYAFSLSNLIFDGRPYGPSPNTPPKHRQSFISQVDKLISDLSKQFAGATAPSDFFCWYAYFCQLDNLDPGVPEHRKIIIQDLQGLTLLFNEPSRSEGEAPFVNLGIYDKIGLESLFGHIVYPDGRMADLDYIMEIQKVYAEWFSKGDPISGFPYKFPVVTGNLTTDSRNEFVDIDTARWLASVNRNMGNFNIHFGDKAKLAMCCRYENDLDDMDMSPDSFGNGGVNIGSHRIVTINKARIARLANGDEEAFYNGLDDMMDVASKLLIVHRRDILEKRIQKNPGYLNFFGELKWFRMETMFSTFGITGINETVRYMGHDIIEDDGTDFGLDMLAHMKANIKKFRKEYGIPFNMEEIPGEQACVTLIDKDRIFFDGDVDCHLYSNQYIPLTAPADILTRINLAGRFMKLVSGGGIVHLNVEHQIDTDGKMFELFKLAAKSGITHMAVCHRFGRCENGHTDIIGQSDTCPICGKPIVRSRNRVIGYYSDEVNWNKVRRKHDARLRFFSDAEVEE